MKPYQIVSLPGGGIRGVIQAVLLARLNDACPGLLAGTQMFAGTSIGGISALALAHGVSPAALVRLFVERADDIFDARWLHQVRPGAKYSAEGLRTVLGEVFGATRLAELRAQVLVGAYDCRYRDAQFWHNWPGPSSNGAERCVDVALRTAAAPTFFPAAESRWVDGGLAANDPVTCAIARARKGGVPLASMRVISIGTGRPTNTGFSPGDWGVIRWAPKVIGVALDGPMGVARYQAKALLGEAFHELQVELPDDVPLDAASKVLELVELAEGVDIREAVRWAREHFLPAELAA